MSNTGGFRFGLFLKLGALFFVLLLAFLSMSSFKVISGTRDYLIKDSEKRLLNLADVVSHDIQGHYGEVVRDQYYLYSIFVRESLSDLVLIDRQGRIVIGSLPPHKKGKQYRDFGISPGMTDEVWKGQVKVSPIYVRDDRAVRSVCFPVADDEGNTSALGVVTLDVNYIDDLTQQGTTYFFLKAIISVFLLMVLFFAMSTLMRSEKRVLQAVKGPSRYESGDDVSFMVDTFHSVVGDLKEKERGLKELKDKAEEKARAIESYNENILRSIQSGVMTFGADCRVKTANSAAETILKMPADVSLGKGVEDIFGEGGWVSVLVRKTLSEGRPERRAEGEVAIADGAVRWLGASTSPLMGEVDGEEGRAQGVILVFTDITEVKELRDRMELKERLTLMGEMSAGIAHELRNPMGVISGYADLLARRLGDDDSSREAARSITAEIKLMDEIIIEFMNFSQPTELNVANVDVKGLIEEALKPLAGKNTLVKRELQLEEGLPQVEGDPVLLRQAFGNIIKNSIEAMPDGGALVLAARLVDVGNPGAIPGFKLASGRYVNVEVSDTGIGIAENDLRKIFTPFFTTKKTGTGLGLALVQKILVYHGGRVTVKSVKGKGTTFNVYLPVAELEKAGP